MEVVILMSLGSLSHLKVTFGYNKNATTFGWDLQELIDQNKLFILDASPDPDGQDVAGNFDLSGLIEGGYAIRKYKAKELQ